MTLPILTRFNSLASTMTVITEIDHGDYLEVHVQLSIMFIFSLPTLLVSWWAMKVVAVDALSKYSVSTKEH